MSATGVSGPQGTNNTSSVTGGQGSTGWMGGANVASPMFNTTTTNTTYLTQTSQPDIASIVNSTILQMLGRYATSEEIQRYGSELLSAERANPGEFTGTTTYGPSGKRNVVSGTQLTAGVDPSSFIAQQVRGTSGYGGFQAATTAFDMLRQMAKSQVGAA